MSVRREGQVLLEFVLALIGIVLFVYVTVQVWVWVNQMIVKRQETFQTSRLEAGKAGTAKRQRLAPYQREPLSLMGRPFPQALARIPDLSSLDKPPCPAAEQGYKDARDDYEKAQDIYGEYDEPRGIVKGPIPMHMKRMKETAERICKTTKPRLDTAICPECVQDVPIGSTTYRITVETQATVSNCIGVGHASQCVDENWARCAQYWFDLVSREDDKSVRGCQSANANHCLSNIQTLQNYINSDDINDINSLGHRVEKLAARADALIKRADWRIDKADCTCVDKSSSRFTRCQEVLKKPAPEVPDALPDEQVPAAPVFQRQACPYRDPGRDCD